MTGGMSSHDVRGTGFSSSSSDMMIGESMLGASNTGEGFSHSSLIEGADSFLVKVVAAFMYLEVASDIESVQCWSYVSSQGQEIATMMLRSLGNAHTVIRMSQSMLMCRVCTRRMGGKVC